MFLNATHPLCLSGLISASIDLIPQDKGGQGHPTRSPSKVSNRGDGQQKELSPPASCTRGRRTELPVTKHLGDTAPNCDVTSKRVTSPHIASCCAILADSSGVNCEDSQWTAAVSVRDCDDSLSPFQFLFLKTRVIEPILLAFRTL